MFKKNKTNCTALQYLIISLRKQQYDKIKHERVSDL